MSSFTDSRKNRIYRIIMIGLFAAIAYVLSLFPKFALFPPLEVDFSDAPAVAISLMYGPLYGIAVTAVKSILHLTASLTGLVGLLANIIMGGVFSVSAGLFKMLFQKKLTGIPLALISALLAIIPQILCAIPTNIFILFPMYGMSLTDMYGTAAVAASVIAAHNAIKDVLAVLAAALVIYPVFLKAKK